MQEVEVVSLEDLRGLVESMPEDVVITVLFGKGEDIGEQEKRI